MPNPRLLIDQPLAPGAEIALDEGQVRHVGQVLRLDAGDSLRVFNAKDGEWRARVAEKTKRGMRVAIEEKLREARLPPDLDLLFAPVKRHATDLIIEKATELGAARIRPIITQRTIAETVRLDRLAAIAREAAEQTERFDAPEVCEPLSLGKALDGWDAARTLIFADEAGDAPPLLEALRQRTPSPRGEGAGGEVILGATDRSAAQNNSAPSFTPPPNPLPLRGGGEKLALLIGPEGGFAPEERRMLRGMAFVAPVSLGPRILRAETAVIAALTLIQAQWGDWGGA